MLSAPTIKSSKPSPLTSPALETTRPLWSPTDSPMIIKPPIPVAFGKQDNTTINLSDIAAGKGGFVIEGASAGDYSGYSVSSAGDAISTYN
jgi:hypothetical protein